MLTIFPDLRVIIADASGLVSRKTASRFTVSTARQAAALASASEARRMIPALFTTTSMC